MSKAKDHKKHPSLMSHPKCQMGSTYACDIYLIYILMHIAHHIISYDIYLHVFWCTMLLPHALHAKPHPLSTQALFPKPQTDAPIKGIQVQSMP